MVENITKEIFEKIVKESISFPDVCLKLGFDPKKGNIKSNIERKIKRLGISTEHFKSVQKMKNKWNKDKILELVKKYKTYKEIILELDYLPIQTNYVKLKKLLKEWNIEFISSVNSKRGKWDKKTLIEITNNSYSYRECLEKMKIRNAGGNFNTLKKYINNYNIDISHFNIEKSLTYKKDISEYLIENSTCSRTNLKRRLISEKVLENNCFLCGQDENWNNMKISLILDHINGKHNDNRLENLRIVCPNCNAGLDTHCGKNK